MSQHLMAAAERGNLEKIREVLDRGADVNFFPKSRGMTALALAIANQQFAAARLLIERNADKNLSEPLALSCYFENLDLIVALLRAGADPNLANKSGVTPLMIAAREASTEVVQAILNGGGDPNLRNREGKTALDSAKEARKQDTIALLEPITFGAEAIKTPQTLAWPKLVEGEAATGLSPEATVWAFIHAMNRWEIESSRKYNTTRTIDQTFDQILAALMPIMAVYCTERERKYGRTSFGNLAEYDPAIETLLEIDLERPSRAVVITCHERLGRFRYLVIKKAGRWLIDNKKIDGGNKWNNWTL